MLMTVALMDARYAAHVGMGDAPYIVTPDVVYADDTMLLSSSAATVQHYLDAVTAVGRTYGLELNLQKTVLLRIRSDVNVYGSDGKPLVVKEEAVYLGGLLSIHGNSVAEVTRRIGEATGGFHSLSAVWKHANITRQKKYAICMSCVVSKLLYGLESLWLLQADLRRLDGFFARCLRKIAGIPPSFYSRVSNERVLKQFDAEPLSVVLKRRQVMLYGKLVKQPADSLTRRVAIEDGSFKPKDWKPHRRVGRPCQRWTQSVFNLAVNAFGSELVFERHLDIPAHLIGGVQCRRLVLNH